MCQTVELSIFYRQIIYDSCRGGRPRQGKSSTLVKYLVHPSSRHATCRIVESGSLLCVPRALTAAVELYNKNKMQIIRNSRGQGGFNLR